MSLYWPKFHVTPVDLCIIFQCNLYICPVSCLVEIKLFQIISSEHQWFLPAGSLFACPPFVYSPVPIIGSPGPVIGSPGLVIGLNDRLSHIRQIACSPLGLPVPEFFCRPFALSAVPLFAYRLPSVSHAAASIHTPRYLGIYALMMLFIYINMLCDVS